MKIFILLFSVSFVYLLFILGYWTSTATFSPPLANADFLNNVAPEIGGAGLDIVVGGFSALLTVIYLKWQERKDFVTRLQWWRRTNTEVDFSNNAKGQSFRLPLYGFQFQECDITDVWLNRCYFSKDKLTSNFSNTISASIFKRCLFGNVCFEEFKIFDSLFLKCDFRKAVFKNGGVSEAFTRSVFISSDFCDANFVDVSLEGGDFRLCRFWGAKFQDGARMPMHIYDKFLELGMIRRLGDHSFVVVRRWKFWISPESHRIRLLWFVARSHLHNWIHGRIEDVSLS